MTANAERGNRLKVYGASRASLAERPATWKTLRAQGAFIVSTWIDEAEVGATDDFRELWCRIEAEIRSADRLVLYVEAGDFPLKGAMVEVWMAIAMGKPVWVVAHGIELDQRNLNPLGSWARHPGVTFCENLLEAVGLSGMSESLASIDKPNFNAGAGIERRERVIDNYWSREIIVSA